MSTFERLLTTLATMGTMLLGHIIYKVYIRDWWIAKIHEYLKESDRDKA